MMFSPAGILLLAASAPAQLSSEPPRREVSKELKVDGQVILEGLGACEDSPQEVVCWNMEGSPSPDLAELVRAYYISQPENVPRWAYRHKNRLLAVRSKSPSGTMQLSASAKRFSESFTVPDPKGAVTFLRFAGPPDEAMGSVNSDMSGFMPQETVVLEPKKGAKGEAKIGVLEVEEIGLLADMTSIQSAGFGSFGSYAEQVRWGAVLQWRGAEAPRANFAVTILDFKDKPVGGVNDKGEPVPLTVRQAQALMRRQPGPKDPRVVYSYIQEVLPPTSQRPFFLLYTNVDPKHIGKIQLRVGKIERITLTGFPLDPAKS